MIRQNCALLPAPTPPVPTLPVPIPAPAPVPAPAPECTVLVGAVPVGPQVCCVIYDITKGLVTLGDVKCQLPRLAVPVFHL